MRWLTSLLSLFLCCGLGLAGDWPQWLGPNRDNSTTEKIAPWKNAPKVVWHVPLAEGHSAPVVAGGRVFMHVLGKEPETEEVIAINAADGDMLWKRPYPRVKFSSLFGQGPRAAPAVDGDRLYTLGVTGILTCWEESTGKQLWQIDTLKQFNATNLMFGVSCSPLIEGKNVFVNVGGKGASIVALDKMTGKTAWQALDDKASYSSPIAMGSGKSRQVVFLTGQGVASLNPENGSVFWQYPMRDRLFESSATPVRSGDYLLASSITFGSAGLKLTQAGDKPAVEEAWKNTTLTSYFATPVCVGPEHAFLVTGSNPLARVHEAALQCIETRTGKVLWSKPKVGEYHATLLKTGDDKLLMLDDAGNLILLDPNPKEYRELARSKVCGKTWVHPALANGRLFVRDEKELLCLQLGD